MLGKIVWLCDLYGFIKADRSSQAPPRQQFLFLPSDVDGAVEVGDRVSFDAIPNERRPGRFKAVNVRVKENQT